MLLQPLGGASPRSVGAACDHVRHMGHAGSIKAAGAASALHTITIAGRGDKRKSFLSDDSPLPPWREWHPILSTAFHQIITGIFCY